MKKHWLEYLPEAGRIANRGADQISLLNRITDLKYQISLIKSEFNQNEIDLEKLALTAWSEAEISDAKETAMCESVFEFTPGKKIKLA